MEMEMHAHEGENFENVNEVSLFARFPSVFCCNLPYFELTDFNPLYILLPLPPSSPYLMFTFHPDGSGGTIVPPH
jgi:hypothetical protein